MPKRLGYKKSGAEEEEEEEGKEVAVQREGRTGRGGLRR